MDGAIHYSDPGKMSTRDVIARLSTDVFAGSGMTAIALKAIVYLLLRNPKTMDWIVCDIDEANRLERLSSLVLVEQPVICTKGAN
jgi:cytochrome P450